MGLFGNIGHCVPLLFIGLVRGSGPSGFHETIDWLKAHGYTGYILLENYYDQLPLRLQAENPYDLLREDIRILRQALQ